MKWEYCIEYICKYHGKPAIRYYWITDAFSLSRRSHHHHTMQCKMIIALLLLLTISSSHSDIAETMMNFKNVMANMFENMVDDMKPLKTLDEKIIYKLKKLKKTAPVGNPGRGIPILDPYTVPYVSPVDIESRFLRLGITVEKVKIYGLKDLQVNSLKVQLFPPELQFSFVFPALNINFVNYTFDSRLLNLLPLRDKGNVAMKLQRFVIKGHIRISLKQKFAKITSLALNGYARGFEFSVFGKTKPRFIYKAISIVLTLLISKLFKANESAIWRAFSNYVLKILEAFIQNMTLQQIIKALENDNDGLLSIH